MKKRSEEGMAPRVEWAGFARKKGLDSHSLHLTLTGHAIFVKNTDPSGPLYSPKRICFT